MEIIEAKTKIDYDRQLAMFGKERADTALQFYMLGANENEQQLFVEERQNEMLIKECESLKKQGEADWFEIGERDKKIEELKEAVNWALNNCKPDRDELHSDFFNILTNAVNCHIDEEIKHVRNKTGYR